MADGGASGPGMPTDPRLASLEQEVGELREKLARRGQAEEALRASEEKYRRLHGSMRDAFASVDMEGRLTDFNEAYRTMLGYETWELAELTYVQLTPERWHAFEAEIVRKQVLPKGFSDIYEKEYRKKDGTVFPVELRTFLLRDSREQPAGMWAIVRDITERKRTLDALRESEERLRLKLDSLLSPGVDLGEQELASIIDAPSIQRMMEDLYAVAGLAMAIVDMRGQVLVAVGWQDICTRFHRLHPETLRNCNESDVLLSDGVPPGEFRVYKCKNNLWDIASPIFIGDKHVGNVFAGQLFYEGEVPDVELFAAQAEKYGFDREAYLAALERVPRLSRATVESWMRFLAMFASMTSRLGHSNLKLARSMLDQQRINAALEESEQRYREVFDNTSDCCFLIDVTPDNHLVFARFNTAQEQATGLSNEQVAGRALEEVLGPLRAAELTGKLWTCVRTGRPSSFEDALETPVDCRCYFTTLIPIRDGNGRVYRIVGIGHDVTERRHAEEQIRQLNAQLEQRVAERTVELASVNQELESFAYSVSHDLRAPLLSIDGFSQLLMQESLEQLAPEGRDHVHRIRASTQKMAGLIDALLGLSRVQRAELHRENVNVSELVRSVVEELRPAPSARTVEFVVQEGLSAEADPRLLRVALENLIGNALKYTGRHPRARIEIGACDSPRGRASFVRDDGAGFDMTYVHKLFGPFQRLHPETQFPGTGIGLATVRRIVERHGGQVWAEGAPERGATFYFTLSSPTARCAGS